MTLRYSSADIQVQNNLDTQVLIDASGTQHQASRLLKGSGYLVGEQPLFADCCHAHC